MNRNIATCTYKTNTKNFQLHLNARVTRLLAHAVIVNLNETTIGECMALYGLLIMGSAFN